MVLIESERMLRLGLLYIFGALLPFLSGGNKIAYYSSNARPEQCEEGTAQMLVYSYTQHDTLVRLANIFDGVSWAKSGVLSTPSPSKSSKSEVVKVGEGSGMEKAISMIQTKENKVRKETRVVRGIESLSTAIDTLGEIDDAQLIELAIDGDLFENTAATESSLKTAIAKVQAHACGVFLFVEKADAGDKMTKKTEDSMLFGEGIFGSVTGVERLLSSTSYSSSSAYLSMTPEILVGLILGASFLATILIGLGCTNDIRGASVFTDEKSIPPIGKES